MSANQEPIILKITDFKIPPIFIWFFISLLHVGITSLFLNISGAVVNFNNLDITRFFTFTFGYVVFITRIIHNSHTASFLKLLNSAGFDIGKTEEWKKTFFTYRNTWPETLIATIVGGILAYIFLSNSLGDGRNLEIYYWWRAIQVVLIWIMITQSTSLFMRNTTIMNRLFKEMQLDLINVEKLMPLTKAGITSTLAFIGAYSILFIDGIDITQLDNPALFILIPTVIFLLITPLKGVGKRIGKAKEDEIALIDRAIDGDMDALKSSRLKNNLENLNAIDLISYKKMIENILEIPINIPTASRFIFYLVIPFLTWIAGSIVDKVIDYLIA